MPSKRSRRSPPKRRNAHAKSLADPKYRQRIKPGKVKSRGRKRMEEIYAFEERCVNGGDLLL